MVIGILQARMGSRRLPGKVLMNILGKPMLMLQIERIKRANLIDKLVVATTKNSLDDKIEKLCSSIKVLCFRGSENDLLDRYYQTAKKYQADYIVRLTGDDPLTDPELINSMIKKMKTEHFDAVTNTVQPTFPEGLDVTVLSFEALRKSWRRANLQSQREHVTPYVFDDNNDFNVYHYKQSKDQSNLRWTVDYENDFIFVENVYNALYPVNNNFSTNDVYRLLKKNPSLELMNSEFIRDAGLIESIKNDAKVN